MPFMMVYLCIKVGDVNFGIFVQKKGGKSPMIRRNLVEAKLGLISLDTKFHLKGTIDPKIQLGITNNNSSKMGKMGKIINVNFR